MKAFILKNSVELAHMDMCQVGMVVDNELVLKPTTFMTNGPKLAEALRLKCPGGHCHGRLIGGSRCRRAQVYPPALCQQIMKGFRQQLQSVAHTARLPQSDCQSLICDGTPPKQGANETVLTEVPWGQGLGTIAKNLDSYGFFDRIGANHLEILNAEEVDPAMMASE